jgi:hypothetical protein
VIPAIPTRRTGLGQILAKGRNRPTAANFPHKSVKPARGDGNGPTEDSRSGMNATDIAALRNQRPISHSGQQLQKFRR